MIPSTELEELASSLENASTEDLLNTLHSLQEELASNKQAKFLLQDSIGKTRNALRVRASDILHLVDPPKASGSEPEGTINKDTPNQDPQNLDTLDLAKQQSYTIDPIKPLSAKPIPASVQENMV
jgi:hypothetical protein